MIETFDVVRDFRSVLFVVLFLYDIVVFVVRIIAV